ncbi:phosphate ABC transporter substrate-binding protein [Moritella marina ATCC 15381]|jgi:ABC-type phosphate transport system substrate-binding protein|uniref:Phosphate ABC transporter substrate-binding protein n=1 Tax=Moritella marina ATCC 15381 TaxID=1202962 RepID=A0A5J6WSE5_MORMI|nr:phosphate ABC transporter substrate-binding protein [Moritella marina]QFI40334.1 phosphate ABC transporter substrate-binding protein [Moritella marina ATCC 15381]
MNLLAKVVLTTALFSGVAQAGVVVIGNPSGPDALSKSQVSKLYLGKSKKLPNGSKASVLEQAKGSTVRDDFHGAITGKSDAQLQAYWSRLVFTGKGKPPKSLSSSALVKNSVASNINAIGYIDEADLDASVKVVFKP